jgi:hypothetical protein
MFYSLFFKANIWGNIISSTILKTEAITNNITNDTISLCGSNDCPGLYKEAEVKRPQLSTVSYSFFLFLFFI